MDILDGQGKLALPDFVDGHTHAAQTLLRVSVVDELPIVCARILVPFESARNYEDTYAGAILLCLQDLRAGITHLPTRAVITLSTMDQGTFVPDSMKDSAQDAIARTEVLYDAYHNPGNERIKIWFGVHQAITTSSELAETIADRSKALQTGVPCRPGSAYRATIPSLSQPSLHLK